MPYFNKELVVQTGVSFLQTPCILFIIIHLKLQWAQVELHSETPRPMFNSIQLYVPHSGIKIRLILKANSELNSLLLDNRESGKLKPFSIVTIYPIIFMFYTT